MQETILREGDEFTLYILDIICQEFIAHSIAARQWNPNSVLKHCVAYLCKDLGWLQALSAKQAFCWGLVTPYCSRIHVVPDHFEWLHTYIYVITELSKIFITYCTTKEVSEDSSEDVSPCNEPDVERLVIIVPCTVPVDLIIVLLLLINCMQQENLLLLLF